MKINITTIPTITLQEFAAEHNLELDIRERPPQRLPGTPRFYASLSRISVKNQGFLIGATGNGDTPQAAVDAYCQRIAGKLLVHQANGTRREFYAPAKLIANPIEQEER